MAGVDGLETLLPKERRDGVIELLVAPVLQPALPIGGGEGASCDDCGVLVIDAASGWWLHPCPAWAPLSTLLHCSAVFASKKWTGGRGVLRFLRKQLLLLHVGPLCDRDLKLSRTPSPPRFSILLPLLHPVLVRIPGDDVYFRIVSVYPWPHHPGLGGSPEGDDHGVLGRLPHRLLKRDSEASRVVRV